MPNLIGRHISLFLVDGDDVSARLAAHNKDPEKAFWNFVCVITSKDLNLTAAHVRYLESSIIRLINREGRASLANRNEPAFDRLPEADSSDMEDFVARLQVLLPVLGIQFIRPTPKLDTPAAIDAGGLASLPVAVDSSSSRASTVRERPTTDGEKSPVFEFSSPSANAKAVEIGGQMIVLKGSQAQSQEQPSLGSNVRTYREQLKRSEKLVRSTHNDILELADDVAFTSPSAAAQAVMGTSRNGRVDWIVENTGETYAKWQEAEINKAQKYSPET
jgi:hypothetical protein